MDNPYETPKSDLDNGIVEPRSKKLWRAFFWFMLLFNLISLVSILLTPDQESTLPQELISLVVYPIIVLGLFGFAYDKRFISSAFWKVWILIAVVSDIYVYSEMLKYAPDLFLDLELSITLAVILALIVPIAVLQYMGLYQYAFQSSEIWGTQDKTKHPVSEGTNN